MHEFAVLNCTYIFLILKIFPNLFFFYKYAPNRDRSSAVGIVTRHRDGRYEIRIPAEAINLSLLLKCSYLFLGPSRFLSSGYQSSLSVASSYWSVKLTNHLYFVLRSRMSGAIIYSLYTPSRIGDGQLYLYLSALGIS